MENQTCSYGLVDVWSIFCPRESRLSKARPFLDWRMYEYVSEKSKDGRTNPTETTASPSRSDLIVTDMENNEAEADAAAEPVELIWENAHSRKIAMSKKGSGTNRMPLTVLCIRRRARIRGTMTMHGGKIRLGRDG